MENRPAGIDPMSIVGIVLLAPLFLVGCQTVPVGGGLGEPGEAPAPVHEISEDAHLREWLILGLFPNPEVDEPLADGTNQKGYGEDYLAPLGGEAGAALSFETRVPFMDEEGKPQTAVTRRAQAKPNGHLDLNEYMKGTNRTVTYAFAYIQSDRDQTMHCFFGSDDSAKVWVNGELVHAFWAGSGGRAVIPRTDDFPLALREGVNPVLVKVMNGLGDYGLMFEVLSIEEAGEISAERERIQAIRDFQNVEIRPKVRWNYMFPEGEFPEIVWDSPCTVENVIGDVPLDVRWYDAELNEVTGPPKPGRYAAYVEGTAADGRKIRRALTLYCHGDWHPWASHPKAYVEYLHGSPINRDAWEEQREMIASRIGDWFAGFLSTEPPGAILMSHMAEMKPLGREATQLDWPETRHQDYHLTLKRRLLGVENKYPELALPRRKEGAPATVLRPGSPEEAAVRADAAKRIREVCREWYDTSGEPFAVLVARHGVIVIHEPFGSTEKRPIDLKTHFPLASLTKLHAGLLFAQFIDQGLIGVDDPVGGHLPDFPIAADKAITLRHCLTHTTGLEGHGEWGGMNNPWLDNVIANGLDYLRPGEVEMYNGMGFDLAGKVMEIVSGKSIFRLFHENFFTPLGQDAPTIIDLGFGISCTVEDLARVGQLMLNHGSYGETEFFSPETFEQLLPYPHSKLFPGLPDSTWEYGLGIDWMRQPHPDAGKAGLPEDATILSKNTIGHGAASSTVLRVDLDNDLVVAVGRFNAGKKYNECVARLLQAVEDGLE